MRFSYANIRRLLAGVVIGGALVSCGSASNNDQGVSFTLLGYFQAAGDTTDTTTLPAGLTGVSIVISEPGTESAPGADNFGGGTILAYIGLQNNIVTEFIRADQTFFEYNVPGATVQPPSTNYALSVLVGPGQSSNPTISPSSSLPGGFTGFPTRAFAQVPVISAEIREWLNFNRDLLPDRPFVMTVRTTVGGVTSAGDRLYTNAADLFVQVNDDTIITPNSATPDLGDLGL